MPLLGLGMVMQSPLFSLPPEGDAAWDVSGITSFSAPGMLDSPVTLSSVHTDTSSHGLASEPQTHPPGRLRAPVRAALSSRAARPQAHCPRGLASAARPAPAPGVFFPGRLHRVLSPHLLPAPVKASPLALFK